MLVYITQESSITTIALWRFTASDAFNHFYDRFTFSINGGYNVIRKQNDKLLPICKKFPLASIIAYIYTLVKYVVFHLMLKIV